MTYRLHVMLEIVGQQTFNIRQIIWVMTFFRVQDKSKNSLPIKHQETYHTNYSYMRMNKHEHDCQTIVENMEKIEPCNFYKPYSS